MFPCLDNGSPECSRFSSAAFQGGRGQGRKALLRNVKYGSFITLEGCMQLQELVMQSAGRRFPVWKCLVFGLMFVPRGSRPVCN